MSITSGQRLSYFPLRKDMLDAILEIEIEAYPEPWSRGMFAEELRSQRSYFCMAMIDKALVGYGGFWLVLDEAHITSVTVAIEQRRRGFGRDLMMHLMDTAQRRGACQATLEVRDSNISAKRLYESLGFDQVGLRRGYYSSTKEDALVMMKEF